MLMNLTVKLARIQPALFHQLEVDISN
uniref:Uncharacterized protein n=1 Tax=Arundo donax TaxID=35708 RepID=A0A0A9HMK0_ARUDO